MFYSLQTVIIYSVTSAHPARYILQMMIKPLHTLSGIGTSSCVPEGACTVSIVSPWKQRHTSSCVT